MVADRVWPPMVGAGSELQHVDLTRVTSEGPGCENAARTPVSHACDEDPWSVPPPSAISLSFVHSYVSGYQHASSSALLCLSLVCDSIDALSRRVHIHFLMEHQVRNLCQDRL